ncbi:SPOR domain-containing protein [Gammaproteobacteria bacterium]|nr:SPOR domain-containing protein [Gammaproteobacteria bacterium]
MNESLKKRVIGVIILLIAFIVIAPIIFKGSGFKDLKYSKIEDQKNITFKYIDKAENLNKKGTSKIKKSDIFFEEKVIKGEMVLDGKKNFSNRKSWSIRVGSFSDKVNAENLLKKLKLIKYQSYIIKINKDNRDLYTVNVGPFFLALNANKSYLEIVKKKDYKNSYIIESNFKK